MVLDGRTIVEKNYVTLDSDSVFNTEEQVQPNGIDLRVHAIKHVVGNVRLPREGRLDAKSVQIHDIPAKDGWFSLPVNPGNYLVDFIEHISVPDGYCAIIIARSSMVRTGVHVLAGLWDTGFQGRLGATIRNLNPVEIQYGARLAQVMFLKAQFSGHRYSGNYQGTTQSEFK